MGYVWLSQGTYRMMPWSGLRDIDAMMRDGRIAFELARPRDLFSMWYGRAMSLHLAPLLINLPLVLLAALLLPGTSGCAWRCRCCRWARCRSCWGCSSPRR